MKEKREERENVCVCDGDVCVKEKREERECVCVSVCMWAAPLCV